MFADAALESGVLPALLGILGALAFILKRSQVLASTHLLDPSLQAKNRVALWLGLIAGGGVGSIKY